MRNFLLRPGLGLTLAAVLFCSGLMRSTRPVEVGTVKSMPMHVPSAITLTWTWAQAASAASVGARAGAAAGWVGAAAGAVFGVVVYAAVLAVGGRHYDNSAGVPPPNALD